MKIAVCGKGGSGKSTVATLLAKEGRALGYRVLVVDSDESNSGLFRMLGFDHPPVPLLELLGGRKNVRQNMVRSKLFSGNGISAGDIPAPYSVEGDGMILISIGKILQSLEGCACPMGALSREFLSKLTLKEDELAIVDMEAGVEHFGRGVESGIDSVLIVVEPPLESVDIGQRIHDLAAEIGVKHTSAVLNKVPSAEMSERLGAELRSRKMDVVGSIAFDADVFMSSLEGSVPRDGTAVREAGQILRRVLDKAGVREVDKDVSG